MNKKIKNLIIVLFACLVIFPVYAFAYTLLQPLPGITEVSGGQGFSQYLSWIFKFALIAAAFLAVIQIVIAGVEMVGSAASEKARGDAEQRIRDAVLGLLLAFGAWLILYTINPDLVKMELNIPDINIKAVPVDSGEFREVDRNKISAAAARDQFSEIGIDVKSECPPGQSVNCVRLEGVRQSTIDELKNLKEQFPGAQIYVTGGTESGHSSGATSHSNGYKVDLRLNTELDKYIMENFTLAGVRSDGAEKWINPKTGAVYALERGGDPHWDVVR